MSSLEDSCVPKNRMGEALIDEFGELFDNSEAEVGEFGVMDVRETVPQAGRKAGLEGISMTGGTPPHVPPECRIVTTGYMAGASQVVVRKQLVLRCE